MLVVAKVFARDSCSTETTAIEPSISNKHQRGEQNTVYEVSQSS